MFSPSHSPVAAVAASATTAASPLASRAASSAASRPATVSSASLPAAPPYHLPSYYGQQSYGQEYHGMYQHAASMEAAAWHHAYSNPLGHLYRGYDVDWPHSAAPSDIAIDPTVNGATNSEVFTNSDCGNATQPRLSPVTANDYNGRNFRVSDEPASNSAATSSNPSQSQSTPDSSTIPEPSSATLSNNPHSPAPHSSSAAANVSDIILNSRPQPARSPYEWMKRPVSGPAAFQKSGGNSKEGMELNARTRTKDKYRVVYSDHQRLELEKEFHYSRYITIRRKSELAQALNLTERQVKIWFQNRRAKERKHLKKRDELLHKEKLDQAVSLHAAAAVAAGTSANLNPHSAAPPHHPHMFATMGHMLHHGMGVTHI